MITEIAGTIAEELLQPIVATPTSTCIQTIEWNPVDGNMRVTFVGGSTVYDFPGISREQVQDFINAPSVGRYYAANFKTR